MTQGRSTRGGRPRWPLVLLAVGLAVGCATPLVARQGIGLLTPQADTAAALTPTESAEPAPAQVTKPAPARRRSAAPDMRPLQTRLEEFLAEQDGLYGVYVLDLNSGRSAAVHENDIFPTASTFKLPLAMYILDEAAKGRVDLDEPIAYTDAYWEDGTGILQEQLSEGDTRTVRELVELAITESDNIATNMLIDRFGVQNVYDYMERLGGTVTQYEPGVHGSTPREMATYLRLAMSDRAVGDKALRDFLFGALTSTSFHERVEAGVPEGVKVAHKVGTLPGVVNDVALVYAPQRRFIVSVFSLDVGEETAKAVIAEIAAMVYEHETEMQ